MAISNLVVCRPNQSHGHGPENSVVLFLVPHWISQQAEQVNLRVAPDPGELQHRLVFSTIRVLDNDVSVRWPCTHDIYKNMIRVSWSVMNLEGV